MAVVNNTESRRELTDNIDAKLFGGDSQKEFIEKTAKDAIEGNINADTLESLNKNSTETGKKIISTIEEQTGEALSDVQKNNSSSQSKAQPDPQPQPQPEPSEPSQPLQTVRSPQSNSSSSSSSISNSSGGVVNRSESGEAPNVIENPATDNESVDMGITTVGNNDSGSSSSSSSSKSGISSMIDSIDPKIIAGVAALVVFLMR